MPLVVMGGIVVVVTLMDVAGRAPAALLAGCAGAYVAGAYGITRWTVWLGLRRLMRPAGPAGEPGRAVRLISVATQVYLVAVLAGLMLAGWGGLINQRLALQRIPLLGKALALGPFVAALVVHWWAVYPLERALRLRLRAQTALNGEAPLPVWSRRQFVAFNVRHHLLFVAVPAAMIFLALDLPAALGASAKADMVALVAAAGVLVMAPTVIVWIWRTRPLPAGTLRQRLDDYCRRIGLTYRQLLVWDTGGVVVNAGVMGLLRPVRYVLLSDALLGRLDADAVESVFAHEAGHVIHHHIGYLVLFTTGVLLVCATASEAAARALGLPGDWAEGAGLLAAAVAWLPLFGALSRRFERQADVFAAAAGGDGPDAPLTGEGVARFTNALLAIGRLNGISPRQRNFRHGSIRRRLDYLLELSAGGCSAADVDATVARIKVGIWVLLGVGTAAAALLTFAK